MKEHPDEHKPADGVFVNAELSDDYEEALREYAENPIIYSLVLAYAEEHDLTVEEVVERGFVAAEAPLLGLPTVGQAVRTQQLLEHREAVERQRDQWFDEDFRPIPGAIDDA